MNFSEIFNFTIIDDYLKSINIDLKEYSSGLNYIFDIIKFTYFSVLNFLNRFIIDFIGFTDFQLHILQTFCLILLINCLLILFYWNKYGNIITDRFIRPSTLKEIEELKQSVARLKLPKEHSPRI